MVKKIIWVGLFLFFGTSLVCFTFAQPEGDSGEEIDGLSVEDSYSAEEEEDLELARPVLPLAISRGLLLSADVCGNGVIESKEECDDGNEIDNDICSNLCTSNCGNELPNPGEECDSAEAFDAGTCSRTTCQWIGEPPSETVCGDGRWEPPEEECDGGKCCSVDCEIISPCCGDYIETGKETCDDGNTLSGDGCDLDCQLEVVCGDGTVESPETCEIGDPCCNQLCELVVPCCGNTTIESGETCDDGNLQSGDGCSAICQDEPVCGNTVIESGEDCESGLCCDANCHWESNCCGNTTTEGNEQCDGESNCTPFCTWMATPCGNGTIDAGEDCDGGLCCDADCNDIVPCCGNITIEASETCDDGNQAAGDGCDTSCQLEPECGNRTIETGENCDDGNTFSGDGCSSDCQKECGNGIRDVGEECDPVIDQGCTEDCEWENPDPADQCPYVIVSAPSTADPSASGTIAYAGHGQIAIAVLTASICTVSGTNSFTVTRVDPLTADQDCEYEVSIDQKPCPTKYTTLVKLSYGPCPAGYTKTNCDQVCPGGTVQPSFHFSDTCGAGDSQWSISGTTCTCNSCVSTDCFGA